MWRSSLWNDFVRRWTRFNCPSRHCFFFVSFCFFCFFFHLFSPLFGRFVFTFFTMSFTYWHVFLNSCILLALYGFARCCDKRISSLTLNSLRVERLQRGINTNFCSDSVQSNHSWSGNESLINGCVIGCLPFFLWANRSLHGFDKWYAKYRTGKFRPKSHLPFVRVSFIYRKATAKAWNWYQRWFEEMEHEFPFEIFRP